MIQPLAQPTSPQSGSQGAVRQPIVTDDVGNWAADAVCQLWQDISPTADRPFVLALPTGGTPLGLYAALVARYRSGLLSFRHIVTVNLDEYVGLPPTHPESYHAYMARNLFDHVDIPRSQTHLLDGNAVDLQGECDRYEALIQSLGGIDLLIGGIGIEGHLAFNEAGSAFDCPTHIQALSPSTRSANSRFFAHQLDAVPTQALTIGLGTILAARSILILAQGASKAAIVARAIAGPLSPDCPASCLQNHGDVRWICDRSAAQGDAIGPAASSLNA
jgi:glucosamine-6-phosphate deaminase